MTPADPERPDQAWTAQAAPIELIEGDEPPQMIALAHREMRNCREGRAIPIIGEAWVAYIEGRIEADTVIAKTWPLAQAGKIDPRFSQLQSAASSRATHP